MDIFNQDKLLYKGTKSNLSETDLKSLRISDFIGFEDFIKLYLIYDGVDFMREAKMYRSKFYNIVKNEVDQVNVSFFFSFKNIISERNYDSIDISPKHRIFIETHIPFADDGFGNSIWIDTFTGIIKKYEHEREFDQSIVFIAPNFKDFCFSLEDLDPNWIKPIYNNL